MRGGNPLDKCSANIAVISHSDEHASLHCSSETVKSNMACNIGGERALVHDVRLCDGEEMSYASAFHLHFPFRSLNPFSQHFEHLINMRDISV